MLQVEHVANLVARLEDRVDIVLRVGRTDAEPDTARHQGRGGVGHDHDDDRRLSILHHTMEHVHFPGIEQEKRDDRR